MLSKLQRNRILPWIMWLIAAIFYALDYFQHTAPSVLIEPIASSLNTQVANIGNIMSIYFPIYAISQIPAGYFIDRFGIKLVLGSACLIVSLGLYIMQLPSESMIIIGRVLIAIGSSFAFLGALKTASLWLPTNVFPVAVGLINTIGVVGGMLGQALLSQLILHYDWQRAINFICLFGLVWSLIMFVFLKTPHVKPTHHKQQYHHLQVLKDKQIWIIALYAGIMVGTVVNAFSELYDVVFLESVFSLSAEKAATISTMIFVGIAVGGPSHGYIAKYFAVKRTWMLQTCIATIVFFILAVFSGFVGLDYHVLYGLFFLMGFFVSSMLLSFSIARCCYPETAHATIFALINMVIGVGGFIFQIGLGEVLKAVAKRYPDTDTSFVFFNSIWLLVIPLIFSFFLCYKIRRV